MATVIRLDTLTALDSVFVRADTGSNQGAWIRESDGTTSSSTTGPTANSAGPYVFSESSSSDNTLPDVSTLTVRVDVMAAWTGEGRIFLVRACVQGDGTYPNDSASGLQIQGRASDDDPWTLIDLIEGWGYSSTGYVVGDTVDDSLGVSHTVVQDGGWVDFEVQIPDAYQQMRVRNIPAMSGSSFRHDAALWRVEFQDGGASVAPSFADPTGDAQSWIQNQAIPSITVPEASGTPAPTYAVVGGLPMGIAFDPTTRVLSGSPAAIGSGTITIRATNSEGMADWTVGYTVSAPALPDAVAPSVTIGAVSSVDEDATEVLIASVSGGTYDALAYAWEIASGGGSLSGSGSSITYTPLDVTANTTVEVRVTVTATGTGINAADGTSDTDTDTEAFTVNFVAPVLTAPSFSDDTGDAQSWVVGTAIVDITVPAAAGNPTPTYAVEVSLPTGIVFDTSTRILSGTPTTTGSGTITIRATNSEGFADWTVGYTISVVASRTFILPLPATVEIGTGNAIRIRWEDTDFLVDPSLVEGGGTAYLRRFQLASLNSTDDGAQRILIRLADTIGGDEGLLGPDLTAQFEGNWTITVDGVDYPNTDYGALTSEPYLWQGNTNIDIVAFRAAIVALVDSTASSVTLTLDDGIGLVAPTFADAMGDAISGTVGQPIASVTVPAVAAGTPVPTYAVVGSLPTGVSFNTVTRVISFDESAIVAGSGTITIRATNSEGFADWTVGYTVSAAGMPDLVVSTPTRNPSGDLAPGQNFTLTSVVTNSGNGNSANTTLRWRMSTNDFISVGDPEVGTSTVGALSPNGTSSASITLAAPSAPGTYYYGAIVDVVVGESDTNNNASGPSTVTVVTALTSPFFADNTGDAQSWTVNAAISPITVPVASGSPFPTYGVEGNLPAGIAFDSSPRVISGTPTAVGSGTITVRATNSEGFADWTVGYTILDSVVQQRAPGQVAVPGLMTQFGGMAVTSLEFRLEVETGAAGEALEAYVTAARLVVGEDLLAWQGRAVVDFFTAS